MEVNRPTEDWNQPNNNIPEFRVDPIIVLLLSFITFNYFKSTLGIYF